MKEIRTLEHTYNMRSFLMLCTNCKAAGCLFSALPKWQHVWWCWSHLQLSQRSTVLLKVGFRAGVHACYSQWTAPQTDSKDATSKITPTPHRLVPRDVGHRQCQPVSNTTSFSTGTQYSQPHRCPQPTSLGRSTTLTASASEHTLLLTGHRCS